MQFVPLPGRGHPVALLAGITLLGLSFGFLVRGALISSLMALLAGAVLYAVYALKRPLRPPVMSLVGKDGEKREGER